MTLRAGQAARHVSFMVFLNVTIASSPESKLSVLLSFMTTICANTINTHPYQSLTA
jgi:hypothetical protein